MLTRQKMYQFVLVGLLALMFALPTVGAVVELSAAYDGDPFITLFEEAEEDGPAAEIACSSGSGGECGG